MPNKPVRQNAEKSACMLVFRILVLLFALRFGYVNIDAILDLLFPVSVGTTHGRRVILDSRTDNFSVSLASGRVK